MASSRDEDLDWLYDRSRPTSQPDPTRVLPQLPAEPQAPPTRRRTEAPSHRQLPPRADYRPSAPVVPPPPPFAPPPRARRTGRSRRRRPVRMVFRVLAILLVLVIGWLVAVPAYAWSRVDRVDATPGGDRPGNQPGLTFLLVGSDSREGLSRAEQRRLGTGSTEGQRTDTIMLVYVPLVGDPALISVPRDSYVPIPGNGSNKINAAYAFGGPDLLVQTVEQNTGLRVDGYAEIGFGGFVNIIDALDGIRMCLPSAIKDRDAHIDLPKGCQTLSGTEALGYVRMRKADPRGDLGRVERQRQMLAAVAAKAASPASVLNPVRYWTLNTASADALTLGEGTSLWQTARMGLAMRSIAAGDGLTLTVPVGNSAAATSAGSAVLWDEVNAEAMFNDLARGDTAKLETYAK